MSKRRAELLPQEKEIVASALVAMAVDAPEEVEQTVAPLMASIVAKLDLADTIKELFAEAQATAEQIRRGDVG